MWIQKDINIYTKERGFHIITEQIINQISEIQKIEIGILQLFIRHTSASLTINENTDSTVRNDFENHFNHLVPEKIGYYQHNYEGPDDMPAHIKASLLGSTLNVPIKSGSLGLGNWQGIYICEHRNKSTKRKIIATLHGQEFL